MTNARVVLSDCRDAHAELVDGLQGSEWRRRWTTVVVLLRTVLHVLDKVDAPRSEGVRAAVDARWERLKSSKPQPEILWGFIDADRNLILKEYEHRAGQSARVFVGEGRAETTYHMNTGPFAGQDPREVAADAMKWLEHLLDDVEADAGRP